MVASASRVIRIVLLSALAIQGAPAFHCLGAQDSSATRTVVPSDTQHVRRTLFDRRDAVVALGFVGLTVAMFPLDKHIAGELQHPSAQANSFLDNSATGFEYISSPGSYVIGGSMYAIGALTGNKNLQDLGWHGTEAIILATATTALLKGTLGRTRPFATPDTNPNDFRFAAGFGTSARQSFPSGHTTTAFAAASAVTSELRRLYPQSVWYVAPVLYGGATMVGLSRMYHNKHWASDVVLGAAIGTFSGLKVVRYSHSHPDNRIDRIMLRTSVVPTLDGGVAVALTLPVP
jgi:membrane-associated phospholipid phosphatase